MITSVAISGFRSCEGVYLGPLGPISVLLGKNASGKTNILKGIEFATQIIGSRIDLVRFLESGEILQSDFEVKFIADGREFLFKLGVELVRRRVGDSRTARLAADVVESLHSRAIGEGEYRRLYIRDKGNADFLDKDSVQIVLEIDRDASTLSAFETLIPKDRQDPKIRSALRFISGIRYYPVDELIAVENAPVTSGIIEDIEYKNWLTSPQDKSGAGAKCCIMKLFDLYLNDRESFNEVLSLLGDNGLGLIDDIRVVDLGAVDVSGKGGRTPPFYYMLFRTAGNDRNIPYKSLSFGTRRILSIVVSILHDKSTVLLFEQPEDGIHNGLLHKLIPMLRSYSSKMQYIITSHSPAILNRVRPEEVNIVSRKQKKTSVRKLSESEIQVASKYIDEKGSLSDFLQMIEEE